MNVEIYSHGISYENFICRSMRCNQNFRNAAHARHYHAIEFRQRGLITTPGSVEKQVEKVKLYLTKAISRFLKRRLKKNEREALLVLMVELQYVTSEPALYSIIEKGLNITSRFKNYNH